MPDQSILSLMETRSHRAVFSIFIALILTSCSVYDSKTSSSSPSDPTQILDNPVGFSEVQQYVFNVSCVSCHNSGNLNGGVNLDNYTSANASSNLINNVAVLSRQMPPSPNPALSSFQEQLLAKWITEGSPDAAPTSTPTPTPTATPTPTPTPTPSATPSLTYQTNIAPVISNNHCLNCHATSSPSSGISLGTYSELMVYVNAGNAASSTFYSEVSSGAMPEGFPSLSSGDLTTIEDWINAGAAQ